MYTKQYPLTILYIFITIVTYSTFANDEITTKNEMSFLEQRNNNKTRLLRKMLPPDDQTYSKPPQNIKEIYYNSGDLKLKAWLCLPETKKEKLPVIVYFHGGFSLKPAEVEKCRSFLDAGFIVLMPMMRGENGNPGNFELFMGEVDDARAAVNWIAEQSFVDTERIYTFGHSIGGGISAMLSLFDDAPIVHGGSCGGLYLEKSFIRWAERPGIPFDVNNEIERKLRVLIGNIKWMKHKHYAYHGDSDMLDNVEVARKELIDTKSKLVITQVKGNHFSSLQPAIEKYIQIIQSDIRERGKDEN